MSLVASLREKLVAEVAPELRALPLGLGRWRVLFGDRWRPLLLPVGDLRFQERCLSYYLPGGRRALYARALLYADRLMPWLGLVGELRIEAGPRGFLFGQTSPGQPAYSVVQMGTPGPFEKASVLLVSERGDALTHAKIAAVRGADRQIALEAGWLRELESARELEGQIPRLLAEGSAATGRRYLVTTLAPGARSTRAFTPAHAAFLSALGRVRREVMSFTSSPCLGYLETTVDAVGPRLMPPERASLRGALHDCRVLLGDWTGPFVIGHGDFVPWNIRGRSDRIFVFDWEYARAGANPLADVLNFRLMQRTMYDRAPDADFLAHTLRYAKTVAGLLYPEWEWSRRTISGLTLAYLLEVLLHCTAASGEPDRGHRVPAAYLRTMEARSRWIET